MCTKKGILNWALPALALLVLLFAVALATATPACADESSAESVWGEALGADSEVTSEENSDTASTTAIPIYDADDLLRMAKDPSATYCLMCDIDLSDVEWKPFAFSGTLDGNGHAILNATITDVSTQTYVTYDGNSIPYDTVVSGFFESLEGATVRDASFLGITVDVQTDEPTFVGTVCGYMSDASIQDCVIDGSATLATTGASFGVGGIAGFGSGRMANTSANTTLVCRDLDALNKDEQFMGGAYAGGYIDLDSCDVTIHGYDSDHGYVHDGGLVGIYLIYDYDESFVGSVSNNNVKGAITFFEDNLDRRAYCSAVIGENMAMWAVNVENNTEDFVRDERFEYDVDLLPHDCANPVWSDEHHVSTCSDHGYVQHTCETCGYSYTSDWEPLAHEVKDWTSDGQTLDDGRVVQHGVCERCGATEYKTASADESGNVQGTVAEPANSPDSGEQTNASSSASRDNKGVGIVLTIITIALVAVALVAVVALLMRRRNQNKRHTARPAHRR